MLLLVLIAASICSGCFCCIHRVDEHCVQVNYTFRSKPHTDEGKHFCFNNDIRIDGTTTDGQQLTSSHFYDFVCRDPFGMKCTEKSLKQCHSPTTSHVASVCYITNHNSTSAIYRAVLDSLQQSSISVGKLVKTLERLNGTEQLVNAIDDEMFKQHQPKQRQAVLDYFQDVLHMDAGFLSCLMGQVYQLLSYALSFPFRIAGRVKTPFSYWRKIEHSRVSPNDATAVFIIVSTVDQCYVVLKALQKSYAIKEVRDHFINSRPRGYQSILIVIGEPRSNRVVELQILTEQMDRSGKYGATAHWLYKQMEYGDRQYKQ